MSKATEQWNKATDRWYVWRRANPTQAIIVYATLAVIIAFWIGWFFKG